MRRNRSVFAVAVIVALGGLAVTLSANEMYTFPDEAPGFPYYTLVQRDPDGSPSLANDGEWAAIHRRE